MATVLEQVDRLSDSNDIAHFVKKTQLCEMIEKRKKSG